MNANSITYQNMVPKLAEALPELKARYDRELEWLEEDDLTYPAYSFIFYRHIESLLKALEPEEEHINRAFRFLEIILKHPDRRVADVAEQSVCEKICSDELVLQKAQKYMGPAARKACTDYLNAK